MKKEFSKIIMIYAMTINTIVVFFTLFIVWKSGSLYEYASFDTSPLNTLIPIVGAEMATGSAFYYWKAKAENKLKIALENNVTLDQNSIYSIVN